MDYKDITSRIDELNLDGYKHIKNNDWELPKNLISWLQERDFEEIGKGLASIVFSSKTENFVVKINKGYIDSGYINFVEFCGKNKGNKHLPKLGKIKKYDDWYIIFIEKLQPVTNEFFFSFNFYEFLNKLVDFYQYVRPDNFTFDQILNSVINSFKEHPIKIDDQIRNQLNDIVKLLFEFKKKYGYSKLDLHCNNFMMRGDTIVVIDPMLI